MTNLTVIENQGKLLVNSREVATMVGKRHDHLIRDVKGYCEILKQSNIPKVGVVDFFVESIYEDSKGEVRPCYLLTRKGCDMVAHKLIGEKGVIFTAIYASRFEEMEKQLSNPLPDFNNPIVAARAWADAMEHKALAESQIKALQPKAEYYDALVERNLLTSIRDTAKEIGVPERKFTQLLIDHGYAYRSNSKGKRLKPYAEYNGTLFEIKEYQSSKGFAGTQLLITVKGRETFRKMLQKAG